MTEHNSEEVKAAALAWRDICPTYIACPENAKIMEKEILRLVNEEGHEPESIRTYQIAFANVWDELKLNEPSEKKRPEAMTPEELFALPEPEKENLPSHLLKRLAEFELKQRRAKPQLSKELELLQSVFADEGFAYNDHNRRTVNKWLTDRNLAFTVHNIRQGIAQHENDLSPSEEVIDSLTADEYRDQILKPAFRKEQAAQAPRERNFPEGVRFSRYLHEQ
jgi:hypothetical protein